MCFVVAIIAAVFAINAFLNGAYLMGMGAALTALFFTVLMVRNIMRVKAMRDKVGEQDNDN